MRLLLPSVVLACLVPFSLFAQQEDDTPALQQTQRSTVQIKLPPSKIAPNLPLSPRERALQMLNRFSYGPRPGEVERVLALAPGGQGADKWFDQQLNPASIPDSVSDRRLQDYPTLAMSAEQISQIFPDRGIVEQVAQGRRPYPADPLLASEYEALVWKLNSEQQDKLHPAPQLTDAEQATQKKANQAVAARVAGQLFGLPKRDRMAALNAMPPGDRILFAQNVGGDQRNTLMADFNPREREVINALQNGVNSSYRAGDELAQANIVRAILSERQLQEVMTDFWFNHFNVYVPKDSDQWYTTGYERDAIRPHVFGKFRDLLLATAESPAMMIYLDNWLSIGPDSLANGVNPANPNSKPGKRGLNENYGREVMELHTVGVNGGYTQADVTHLAAILTGWSVDRPQQGGPFQFDPKKHEPGAKEWFGYTIDDKGQLLAGSPTPQAAAAAQAAAAGAPDGMKQGVVALSLLASSPGTAHFISSLLAQRFVDDNPPAALVDRMSATYLASDGDLKAVLHTLTQSPEFNSHRYFRNKVKLPVEFVASAFRATATDPQNPGAMAGLLGRELGEPLYKALPPTGYYVTADVWMNTQSLLARLNFADQLTHNRFANQKFDAPRVLAFSLMSDRNPGLPVASAAAAARAVNVSAAVPQAMGPDLALHVLEGSLIGGDLSNSTDSFIHSQLAKQPPTNPADTLNLLTALLLGSPEFQLR